MVRLVKVGGDPEFEVLSSVSGNIIRASSVISSSSGRIGLDGSSAIAELRPTPGKPRDVVKDLRRLLNRFCENTRGEYVFGVRGDTYPLGFHIHFGFPGGVPSSYQILHFCTILDKVFYSKMKRWHGRARGSYRRPTAYETKRYGFEYRSLPARIAVSPALVEVIYLIAWVLGVRYFNLRQNIQIEGRITKGKLKELVGKYLANKYYRELRKMEHPENFIRYWRIKVRNRRVGRAVLELKDDWHPEVRRRVEDLISRMRGLDGRRIIIFGLAQSRGEVVWNNIGFVIRKYRFLSRADWEIDTSRLAIGLPYEWRMHPRHFDKIRFVVTRTIDRYRRWIIRGER